jgi:hypothetical protein
MQNAFDPKAGMLVPPLQSMFAGASCSAPRGESHINVCSAALSFWRRLQEFLRSLSLVPLLNEFPTVARTARLQGVPSAGDTV